jgi:hypothetical protein
MSSWGLKTTSTHVTTSRLVGRASVLRNVEASLATRRSVLLVGPAGSGKTAIINEVRREGLVVVDPFASITSLRAAALRRALDHGAVVVGAARSLDPRAMGHVGRISWRFERIYLRPLRPRDIRRIIGQVLEAELAGRLTAERRWMSEAADGLPGRAVALASVVAARWRARGTLLPPRLALVCARQDRELGNCFNTTGQRSGESIL